MSVQRQTLTATAVAGIGASQDFDYAIEQPQQLGDELAIGGQLSFWLVVDVACEVELGYSDDGGTTFRMDGHRYRVYPANGWGFTLPVPPGTHVRVRVHRTTQFGDLNITVAVGSVR